VATKIRLMRLGTMRAPHYRVVVVDSRTKRDGRSIETIGKYHPKEDPSYIDIDGERALHWLRVGAQPTEAVEALLKVTGAWQEFKGLPAPPPMLVKEAKTDKKTVFEAAARAAMGDEPANAATTPKGGKKKVDEAAKAATEPTADQQAAAAAEAGTTVAEVRAEESAAKATGDEPSNAVADAVAAGTGDAAAAETADAPAADAGDAPDTAGTAETPAGE
jgi:small subunit ribosomal protein S16